MERIKAENPGLDIDEEVFLGKRFFFSLSTVTENLIKSPISADSESEEELEPLFIPEVPNRILWLQTTSEGTIWLSMAGYDAGYIYEYYIDQTSEFPSKFQIIHDGDDIEISSFVYK